MMREVFPVSVKGGFEGHIDPDHQAQDERIGRNKMEKPHRGHDGAVRPAGDERPVDIEAREDKHGDGDDP